MKESNSMDTNHNLSVESIIQAGLARIEKRLEAKIEEVIEAITKQSTKRFISREEFASETGLGVRTIDRMIAEGRLSAVKEGRRVLIPKNEMSRLGANQPASLD